MKGINKILSFALLPAAVLLAGCNDAEYQPVDNVVYLSAAGLGSKSQAVELEGDVSIPIVVRLAQKSDVDVEVELGFNPANVETYNSQNSVEYVSLPENLLPSGVTVKIPAGEISATWTLELKDFDPQDKTYAVPVQLGAVLQGNVPVSEAQGKFLYVLMKPLIVPVPVFKPQNNNGSMVVASPGEWGLTLGDWTIEAWVRMSGFSVNNQALFDVRSSTHEIYIRFGDANGPYNYLQVKTLGHNGIDSERDFVANTWYHLAFVYTISNNMFRVYRNGQQIAFAEVPEPAGGSLKIDTFKMISSGSTYFRDECAMSQVRFWKTARTQVEIQNNMYYSVSTSNPDLIALWPMDEGDGTTFRDATGNGHDAEAQGSVLRRWEQNIRFDK